MASVKPRVMVVDDEPANLRTAVEALKSHMDLATATNGPEAVRYFIKNNDIDLILLDINMPGMSGFDVLRVLKEDTRTAWIPVVFFSSSQDKTDVQQGIRFGGVGYILKPFKNDVLREKVAGFLREGLNRRIISQCAPNPVPETKDFVIVEGVGKMDSLIRMYQDMASR